MKVTNQFLCCICLAIEDVDDILMLALPMDRTEPMNDSVSKNFSPVSGFTFHTTLTARGPGGGGGEGDPKNSSGDTERARCSGLPASPGDDEVRLGGSGSDSILISAPPPASGSGFVIRRAQQWW